MIKENELLYEFIQSEKQLCIEKQNYEAAANLNDKEKRLENAKERVIYKFNKNEHIRYGMMLAKKRNEKISEILK